MAGRIRDESIAEVREKARIDDVVGQYVTLRNAGGGSQKGLCPFHDEKTPSFNVSPTRQTWHCFGCGLGGDVISFLQQIDGLSFVESVERLADKYAVDLKREEGDVREDRPRGPQRGKLIEANRVAQQYYAEQLMTPAAQQGRQFLTERGFDGESAERFGVGFAPRGGEDLLKHLRQRGFSEEEVVAAGLVAVGRSAYDRFRGRLLWPIRETSGETIGFGARRIFEDDRIEAKYLNTPETTLYKKSRVLYGIDLARKQMGLTSQAVVVEGYTDVMACHLAGVGTAVASCGTAFGDDHAKILRRHMADHEEFRGEVIFTFDGDAAGQAAAIKAFAGDQNFVSQTYVAVEPDGLDPCDLRIKHGDSAVRELIARRVPLYRFVLTNVVSKYDLDRADGRVDALRESARLVSSIRDKSKVDAFAREIARHDRRRHGGGPRRGTPRRQPVTPGRRLEPASTPARPTSALAAPQRHAAAQTAAGPARPSVRDGARDAQARRPAPHGDRPDHQRRRPRGLHAPDLPGGVGAGRGRGGPLAGASDQGWSARLRDAAQEQRPRPGLGGERAGGGAGPQRQGP